MGFFSSPRHKPEDEDMYDNYEDNYAYENDAPSWENEGVQPIRTAADMQVVLVTPKEYGEASKIVDFLRDMRFVILNLADANREIASRLLDFVSGAAYAEDGHIMKVATNVYVVAPYFVQLQFQDNSGVLHNQDEGFSENY